MRKLLRLVASGLCLLLAGCQTPMFSDGLFSSLSPNKTLTTQNASSASSQSDGATKPRIGGRGWRNASTRAAAQETQAPATGFNNVGRLREFLAKGNDAMQKGMFDDARIQYETVLSIEPHHATAHHMLGQISDMSKKFPDAERHYLEALSANREDGYLLSDLGYSYLQQGRLAEARQYLTQAITREPDLAVAKINLAAVYAYGGDERGALAWLRQVGNEQQAQETLAGIVSKPAPWIMNGAAEALANGPDKYTMNKDGQVLDANGQQLTTFAEVQTAMGEIRKQQGRARNAKEQREDFLEMQRINQAMAEERGYDTRTGGANNDANLNQQMRDIEQAAGTRRPGNLNSRPLYIGPPGQNNGPAQGNAQTQYPPQNESTTPQAPYNSQGSVQQFPRGNQQSQYPTQQNPYSDLLNPAGPTGSPQQPTHPNQQVPQTRPNVQGSTVPPQFPGSQPAQTQPPNALIIPPQFPSQQLPQQFPNNAVPRDQYGNPIQSYPQGGPALNSQPRTGQPARSSTAPNPDYFGQSNLQRDTGTQPGVYYPNQPPTLQQPPIGQMSQQGQYSNGYSAGQQPSPSQGQFNQVQSANGWEIPQQQPIQQLGFNEQRPMARIDRGQRIQQYSASERQAMQLGMAAGFGALSPLDTTQSQTPPSSQQFSNSSFRGDGRPYNSTQNSTMLNNNVPNGGLQQPSAAAPTNSEFDNGRPGQYQQQGQQQPDQGYPGAVPANSRQLPGQTNFQAPTRQIHGQSLADQLGQDPQTTQHWQTMPTSQADVTRPVAFSNSTQPTEHQSSNWQRPDLANQAWNNGILASPTSQPGFGQPHMTSPYLRQPGDTPGQQTGYQEVPTLSWGTQQPVPGNGRN